MSVRRFFHLFHRSLNTFGLLMLVAAIGLFARPVGVHAITSNDLTIVLNTQYLASDSNCSSAFPNGGYIEIKITNNTLATLTNLQVDLVNVISSGTPSGVILDPTESPTRIINTLDASQSSYSYFFVNYPCNSTKNDRPTITFNVKVTDNDDASTFTTSTTYSLSAQQAISANAGGNIISMILGAGAAVGQIVPLTVNYNFGNIGNNSPSFNIQPTGDAGFDPSCYRLVASDITAGSGWQTTSGTTVDLTQSQYDNTLNFAGITNPNGSTLTVIYYYQVLCTNSPGTIVKPFAASNSGNQVKYIPNSGTCTSTPCQNQFVTPINPTFQISKTASPRYLQQKAIAQTVTYTVIITNTSTSGGTPLSTRIDKITDVLPNTFLFQNTTNASGVTSSNSSTYPATNATGTLTFVGKPTTKVTNGSLDGSYLLGANGTLKLVYTVTIPANTPVGNYTNTANATTGSTTTSNATSTVTILSPTAVTMAMFNAYASTNAINVRWQTSMEQNVTGFRIYRSTSEDRATATALNTNLIAPHGANIPYVFADATAQPGVAYWYWIEINNSDQANQEFGPAQAQRDAVFTIFMPFLSR